MLILISLCFLLDIKVTEFCEYGSLYDFLHSFDSYPLGSTDDIESCHPKQLDGDSTENVISISSDTPLLKDSSPSCLESSPCECDHFVDEAGTLAKALLGQRRCQDDSSNHLSSDFSSSTLERLVSNTLCCLSLLFFFYTYDAYLAMVQMSLRDTFSSDGLKRSSNASSVSGTAPLRSAAAMMRSPEMGYGLGPSRK